MTSAVSRDRPATTGHVFVVHGRMETLVKDAMVVSTDRAFTVEDHWVPALGGGDPSGLKPEGWGRDGTVYGRAPGGRQVWFLDVSDSVRSPRTMVDGLRGVIEAIASSGLHVSAGRALPLVAVPVPGIGGGAFREHAGEVIADLLAALSDLVAELAVDVVIVATTRAQFAAIQRERRVTQSFPLSRELTEKAEAIGTAAASGRLSLFLGAGVSIPAGLPSWADLVEEMRQVAVADGAQLPAEGFDGLGVLDQTELLRGLLGDRLETLVAQRFADATPALSHALLASLRCREAVTTNYDGCYETAVTAQDPQATIAVMPWQKPLPDRPWLLKLHGDAGRPESVVLTRGQFLGYDSHWRPVGSLFQSLLMTRELLVVGASLTDDNVLRLAHEVRALRQRHDLHDPLGHVLALGPQPLRARLWAGELEWVSMEGDSGEEQARQLEIFLDAVVAHASHSAPYLLHPYYGDLLNDDEESDLAERARELAARIETAVTTGAVRQDAGWTELLAALRAHGAHLEPGPEARL